MELGVTAVFRKNLVQGECHKRCIVQGVQRPGRRQARWKEMTFS